MRKPPSLVIGIFTSYCNYRCKFCYNSRSVGNYWPFEDFVKLAGPIFDHAEIMNIGGCGEISALPYFEQLLDYLETKPGKICFSTNGYRLKPESLRKRNLYEICFSLHSLNPETYDYLTGTQGRLSKVIDNIQQMAAKPRNYRIVIVSVITGRNFNEASDLADFAVNIGADELRFLPLSGALAHIYPPDVVFQETPENLAVLANASTKVHEEHLISRDVLSSKDRIEVVKKMMPTCPNTTSQFIFSMGGEVQPCCYIPIEEGFGNIFNTPWEEIWNGEFYEQFRERVANGTCELCLKYCRNWG